MYRASGVGSEALVWVAPPPWTVAVWAERPDGAARPASTASQGSHRRPHAGAETLHRLTSPRGPVETPKDRRTGAVLILIEGQRDKTHGSIIGHGTNGLAPRRPSLESRSVGRLPGPVRVVGLSVAGRPGRGE